MVEHSNFTKYCGNRYEVMWACGSIYCCLFPRLSPSAKVQEMLK